MRITKYPQSCILFETKGKRILIDPGIYVYEQTDMKPEDFKDIDILLLTHKHSDHCLPEAVKIIKENNPDMIILGNSEINEILNNDAGISCDIVKVGDVREIEGIKIEVVEAVHGALPVMDAAIIHNNGSLEDLEDQVIQLNRTIHKH